MNDKVTVSIELINELLDFVSRSQYLPTGWTIAKVFSIVTQIQQQAQTENKPESDTSCQAE